MVEQIYKEIRTIKKYALQNKVPIMVDDSIDFIITKMHQKKLTKVLEIGTAIGYSAIMMALSSPKLKVVSIERDEARYLEAIKNVKRFGLEDRITLIFNDALNVNLDDKFDLIFLDGAKGKNIEFVEHFAKNLEDDGFFVTDNMSFHGYVDKDESEIKSRNLRGLVRKIKAYIDYLNNSDIYNTRFYEIGDGIAVTSKKEIGW